MSHNWYLLAFGVELGPMSWDDLVERAERGDVRHDSQVRQGEVAAFIRAGDVPGLFGPTARKPAPIAASAAAPAPSMPPAAQPALASAPPTTAAKNASRRAIPGRRVAIRFPGRSLAVLVGGLVIACAAYFGWAYSPSGPRRPEYQQVAALYRQAYEQIKRFRSNPRNQSPAGLQFQFSRTVAALRKQLEPLSGDSSAGRLAEAGTQLSQMLADCQAAGGSAEASRFADNEQRFLAILDTFRGQQQP